MKCSQILITLTVGLVSCTNSQDSHVPSVSYEGSVDNIENDQLYAGDARFSGEVFGDLVYLSWQASQSNSYAVYRQNPTYQQTLALHTTLPADITYFKDRNLIPGQTYYYQLERCSDTSQCTRVGSTVRLRTGNPVRPSAPTTITSATYKAEDNQVLVSWEDVPSAYRYTLWKKVLTGNLGDSEKLIDASILGTSFTDLSPDTAGRVSYRVTACSSDNKCTGYSNEFAVGIGVNVLADPVLVEEGMNGRNVDLSWNFVQLADYYELDRNLNNSGYVYIASTSFPRFRDRIASGISGTVGYRLRACSDQWGCSNYVQTRLYTLQAVDSSQTSFASSRMQATLVPDNLAIELTEPEILFSSNNVFLFWRQSQQDNSTDYFQVSVNNSNPRILSADQPMLELDYAAGQSVNVRKCSDTLFACSTALTLVADTTDIPLGHSSQPVITARLPEAIGITWSSDVSEDFMIIHSTEQFDHLLNPMTETIGRKHVQVSTLEQGKSYSIRLMNCRTSDWSYLYYCKTVSPAQQIRVPEYDLNLGMTDLQVQWDQGKLPLISFDTFHIQGMGVGATADNGYKLVVARDCIGLVCLDLPEDDFSTLESYDLVHAPVVFVDQQLHQRMPTNWHQVDARLDIRYSLWLCSDNWHRCSQAYLLVANRQQSDPYIMAFNPARLGVEHSLQASLAYYESEVDQQVDLHVTRHYTDSLAPMVPGYNLSEHAHYRSHITSGSQTLRFTDVEPFKHTKPWYFNDTNVSSQLQVDVTQMTGADNILRQDELVGLTVEGVTQIVSLTDRQACVQFDNGTFGCSGDTLLSSSHVSDSTGSRHLASIRDNMATPISIVKASPSCGNNDSLSPLDTGSRMFQMNDTLCLTDNEGVPYCLNSLQQGYMCPLTSLVELEPVTAASNSNHLCALGKYNRTAYCWGEVTGAIPFIRGTIEQPMQVHFFNRDNSYPKIHAIYTGERFTCLSYQTYEYCYSTSYNWIKDGMPAHIRFPDSDSITRDRAAYGSLMCWLQTDTSASYIHCIHGGADTDFRLPEATALNGDTLDAFLLATLLTPLSSEAKLLINKHNICVFDRPNLWCIGDMGYADYSYDRNSLNILTKVELPMYQLHDFAMSDTGQFCVSHGASKKLSCWDRGNRLTPADIPERFWPLFIPTSLDHIALAHDYSCAGQGSLLGCWGKTTNPVTAEMQHQELIQAKPVMVDTQAPLLDLQLGRQTACYKQAQGWFCWGKTDHLTELTGTENPQTRFGKASPIKFEQGIEAVSLAPEYDAICILDSSMSVHCAGSQMHDAFDYEQRMHALVAIVNDHSALLQAVSAPVFVGDSICVLAAQEVEYAVLCWQRLTDEAGIVTFSPATRVIEGLPETALVTSSASVLLVYNPKTQILHSWSEGVWSNTITTISLIAQLDQIAIWPSQQPLALGLTSTNDILWLNVRNPQDNGVIGILNNTESLSVGVNNICVRQQTATLCGGDTSYGKSGLIQ